MTKDPIGFKGGVNVFAYVLNDPVNKKDPKGLDGCDPNNPFDDCGLGDQMEQEWFAWLKSMGHYACELGLHLTCELMCLTLPDPEPAGHISCSVACALLVPRVCPNKCEDKK